MSEQSAPICPLAPPAMPAPERRPPRLARFLCSGAALGLLATLFMGTVLGCNPTTSKGANGAMSAADPSQVPLPNVDSGRVVGRIEALDVPPGSDGPRIVVGKEVRPAAPGEVLTAGSAVETDGRSRVSLSTDAGLIVALDTATRVEFVDAAIPTLRIPQGSALVTSAGAKSDGPSAEIIVPTGRISLLGTKVHVTASPQDAVVTVTQGRVEAASPSGIKVEARAGQEAYLPMDGAPYVRGVANLEDAVSWMREQDTEALASAPRGAGTLTGRTPGGEREWPMRKDSQKVDVRVQGLMAYTEVTEVFRNESGNQVEGVYRFPIPDGAQISRLALKVGNRIMEGEFMETARAEQIWRDVVTPRRDPAILKWKEGQIFELRIFPIEPHSTRQVTIGYTERLRASSAGYRYNYPMARLAANAPAIGKFEFRARLNHEGPVQASGFVPDRAEAPAGAGQDLAFSATDFSPGGDLALSWEDATPSNQVRAFGYRDPRRPDEQGYAVFALRPELPAGRAVAGRDIAILVDSSWRDKGAARDIAQRLVQAMLSEMDPGDRVQVAVCHQSCQPAGPREFTHPGAEIREAIAKDLAAHASRGASYPVEALRVAAKMLENREDRAPGRQAHIVYVTDGHAATGDLDPARLGLSAGEVLAGTSARLTLVDATGQGDGLAMEAMAMAGAGAVVKLTPGLSLSANALRVLGRVYGGVLEQARLTLPAGVEQVYPRGPINLGSSEELVVVARIDRPIEGDLVLDGRIAGESWQGRYPVRVEPVPAAGNAFAARLWAEQHIRHLEMSPYDEKREIVRLSVHHGLLSRHTALLALENQEMMDEFGVRKTHRSHWDGKAESVEAVAADAPDEGSGAADSLGGGSVEEEAKGRGGIGAPAPAAAASPAPPASSGAPMESASRRRAMADDSFARAESPSEEAGISQRLSKSAAPQKPSAEPSLAPPPHSVMRDGFDSDRPMRRHRYHAPRLVTRIAVREVTGASPADERAVDRARAALERQPRGRQERRSLVRAHLGAYQPQLAEQVAREWLDLDHLDAEANLALADALAFQGRFDEALASLGNAADANARGPWLQERLARAYELIEEPALACAHRVAFQALKPARNAVQRSAMDCPMATDLAQFGGSRSDQDTLAQAGMRWWETAEARQKGAMTVAVDTTGEAADLHVMVVEPNGRVLGWTSPRNKLALSQSPTSFGHFAKLSLPALANGRYRIHLVRAANAPGASHVVRIDALGKSQTFDLRSMRANTPVAEVVKSTSYEYR